MRGIRRTVGFSLLMAGLLALPALSAGAATLGHQQLAAMSTTAAGISWAPQGDYGALELIVARPDGQVVRHEFAAGKAPSFSLFDATGNPLPDGVYHYELRATPKLSAEARQALAVDRELGETPSTAPSTEGLVQAGAFSILEGAFVSPTETEAPAAPEIQKTSAASTLENISAQDQVIADDLIVQGSECVGIDCVNNENFGFDTIRLKENNLRIKFEDTSSSAGFPTNDWQLTANDSASGGASRFSIDDIDGGKTPFTITAGAPTNSIFVASTGRVGLGTSAPAVNLQVTTGNTPTLRLEQNGSSGFTAETWDVAGNETNFFIRDVTGGSKLPFRIRPGAPTSSIDIAANGDVGIGTASPSEALHVRRTSGSANIKLETTASAAVQMNMANSGGEWQLIAGAGGALNYNRVGVAGNQFVFATNGSMVIQGSLTTGGPTCGSGCDQVFSADKPPESIEQHAAEMWSNHYLPAVGPTVPGRPMNLSEKTGSILNELEKAHIYIAELNEKMKAKDQRLTEMSQELTALKAREAQVTELQERLDRLEAALGSKSQR